MLVTWLLLGALFSGCGSSTKPLAEGALELRREELAVSMLVVNLRDIYNEPMEFVHNGGIGWKERYARVAWWIASNEPPDVLVLQEMPGFWRDGLLKDYEAAQYLIDQINLRRPPTQQVTYRVAYLLSHKLGGGFATWPIGERFYGGLPARGGRALLYRPDKLRNTQKDAGRPFDTVGNSASELMNSLPCCDVRSTTAGLPDRAFCQLIDGPLVTATSPMEPIPPPRATCATPAGAAFTRRNMSTRDAPAGNMEAVFSRLELVNQPGNFVHLYNVHSSNEANSVATMIQLVNDMEARFSAVGGRLYPPILAGDFNLGRQDIEVTAFFPRFGILHWSPEVMGVLIGTEAAFPSKQKVIVRGVRELPGEPDSGCKQVGVWTVPTSSLTLWSDHCASIYFRVLPVYDRPN
ncbi:MAG: endonuclease/exonuclease/phosphatase family protein [Hylemonella sp.]|nr:endonuclease/exonuclease/phosphatase family protein [Hylemonella sp.]